MNPNKKQFSSQGFLLAVMLVIVGHSLAAEIPASALASHLKELYPGTRHLSARIELFQVAREGAGRNLCREAVAHNHEHDGEKKSLAAKLFLIRIHNCSSLIDDHDST